MKDDREMAAKMFGAVRRLVATGGHRADPFRLAEPFEAKDSVIYYFCKGCGTMLEASQDVAEKIARRAEIELPAQITPGVYFESEGCEVCDGDREIIVLKTIDLN